MKGYADLILAELNIIDVISKEIYPCSVAIKDANILAVGKVDHLVGPETLIYDFSGLYASPGFIDGHIHIESSMDIKEEKTKLREKIWEKMERLGIARFPLPCRGRIPNFAGAEGAAKLLRELEEYRKSRTVFVNPDSPQFYVRRQALLDGKTVVMASPRLKAGFIVLKPELLKGAEGKASTIKGAFKYGELREGIPKVDLVVQGSVAVDLHGNRLGKGGGYGDGEIRMVKEKCGRGIKVATTVHSTQVVPSVPSGEGDEKVDLIITEKAVHKASKTRK